MITQRAFCRIASVSLSLLLASGPAFADLDRRRDDDNGGGRGSSVEALTRGMEREDAPVAELPRGRVAAAQTQPVFFQVPAGGGASPKPVAGPSPANRQPGPAARPVDQQAVFNQQVGPALRYVFGANSGQAVVSNPGGGAVKLRVLPNDLSAGKKAELVAMAGPAGSVLQVSLRDAIATNTPLELTVVQGAGGTRINSVQIQAPATNLDAERGLALVVNPGAGAGVQPLQGASGQGVVVVTVEKRNLTPAALAQLTDVSQNGSPDQKTGATAILAAAPDAMVSIAVDTAPAGGGPERVVGSTPAVPMVAQAPAGAGANSVAALVVDPAKPGVVLVEPGQPTAGGGQQAKITVSYNQLSPKMQAEVSAMAANPAVPASPQRAAAQDMVRNPNKAMTMTVESAPAGGPLTITTLVAASVTGNRSLAGIGAGPGPNQLVKPGVTGVILEPVQGNPDQTRITVTDVTALTTAAKTGLQKAGVAIPAAGSFSFVVEDGRPAAPGQPAQAPTILNQLGQKPGLAAPPAQNPAVQNVDALTDVVLPKATVPAVPAVAAVAARPGVPARPAVPALPAGPVVAVPVAGKPGVQEVRMKVRDLTPAARTQLLKAGADGPTNNLILAVLGNQERVITVTFSVSPGNPPIFSGLKTDALINGNPVPELKANKGGILVRHQPAVAAPVPGAVVAAAVGLAGAVGGGNPPVGRVPQFMAAPLQAVGAVAFNPVGRNDVKIPILTLNQPNGVASQFATLIRVADAVGGAAHPGSQTTAAKAVLTKMGYANGVFGLPVTKAQLQLAFNAFNAVQEKNQLTEPQQNLNAALAAPLPAQVQPDKLNVPNGIAANFGAQIATGKAMSLGAGEGGLRADAAVRGVFLADAATKYQAAVTFVESKGYDVAKGQFTVPVTVADLRQAADLFKEINPHLPGVR